MEDVTDFVCSPDYPPHIILEVKCLETEVASRFPGCELTIRDAINKSGIGYYRLPSSSGSRSNSCKGNHEMIMHIIVFCGQVYVIRLGFPGCLDYIIKPLDVYCFDCQLVR